MPTNHKVVTAIYAGDTRYAPGHVLTEEAAQEAGIDTAHFTKLGALKPSKAKPTEAQALYDKEAEDAKAGGGAPAAALVEEDEEDGGDAGDEQKGDGA